jgi:hypothetical protein
MPTHRLPVFHHIERYIQRAVAPRDQPGVFIEDEQLYDDDKTGLFSPWPLTTWLCSWPWRVSNTLVAS